MAPITPNQSGPPGKIKIAEALRVLLKEKDFNSITTADISRTSGVNEALIYRYYKDKRGLLHDVLAKYLEDYIDKMEFDRQAINGAANKLRKLIWDTIHLYQKDRVFAKILLLEVRNFRGYWESGTYQIVRHYSKSMLNLIKGGIDSGEFRDDISPTHIRQIIIGAIEHLCLPAVIFQYEISPDKLTDDICDVIFKGIVKKNNN
ncbi:Transcriptional regulator, AcrR family [Olavius sp. associated proteobacterium Delta 1]|nr:Transcriptional regulator, AcrR family [Olavius sp. associated proteobacterium Delta 1]